MKASELKNLSRQELKEKIRDLKKSLYEMRIKNATARIEKPSKIKEARRDIARLLTVMRDKKENK